MYGITTYLLLFMTVVYYDNDGYWGQFIDIENMKEEESMKEGTNTMNIKEKTINTNAMNIKKTRSIFVAMSVSTIVYMIIFVIKQHM